MISKRLAFAALGCVTIISFNIDWALAAPPAYCALYAREYTAQFASGSDADVAAASEKRIQDQAYYQCLNLDDEPAFPETSVYFGASVQDIVGALGEQVAEGDAAGEPDVLVDELPVAKPKPRQTASAGSGRGSGLEKFTPKWEAWCKAHYPNSFDPITGTVKPYGEERKLCP